MAEAKNSFLASKMNKDLDDRLIPSNEYKDALNVAVSNSEDSDVGALENILENTNVYNIGTTSATVPAGSSSKTISVTGVPLSSPILIGQTVTGTGVPADTTVESVNLPTVVLSKTVSLASNAVVTFTSTNGKIIGHIEDSSNNNVYLLWTNYTDTSSSGLDHHQAGSNGADTGSAIIQYNTIDANVTKVLTQGRFLNFSTNSPVYGINLLEDLLFWTDNRNQPRKINVRKASADNTYYSSEDHISVAKYAPYKPIDLYKDYGGSTFKTTMKDVVSANLPDGSTTNPDYNANYAGDPSYLEDKFVRFSYRFKYDDGEYSIMAPFTQIAFIPKQDGSFLAGDEDATYKSTVVSFMENKVNQIALVINLPDTGNNLENNYKIKELDILYKESDGVSISILDTVTVDEIKTAAAATSVYEYSYQSRKPIKTLPQAQTTRVYDKTPVRAFAQEVSGNRVIYGNYINKHTAPEHLNYQVTATQKFTSGTNWTKADKEYPEHTLKRNRNYQVGFILSDRYGRESDVILSSVINDTAAGGVFGASTFYLPYRASATDPATVLADIGSSIKIQLNEQIQSNKSSLTLGNISATGEPGLYDATENPTGWYSYKVVVKQTQQEYYNVYLPGIVDGYLNGTVDVGKIAHAPLIGDNINKIPRELQEVGPDQTLYSADAVLYPMVQNQGTGSGLYNEQVYSGNSKYNAVTIADFEQLDKLGQTGSHIHIYNEDENPLIVRIQTPAALGETHANTVEPYLAIVETSPFVSNIDIYYETSTSGLISDLNSAVAASAGNPAANFNLFDYTHKENQDEDGGGSGTGAADSPYITSEFLPVNNLGANLTTTTATLNSVVDGLGADRTSEFVLDTSGSGYRLETADKFYYGPDASSRESYTFSIGVTNTADNTTADVDGATTSSITVAVDNIATSKEIFIGHIVTGTGVPASTTVTGVSAIDMSAKTATFELSSAVSLANNTALTFTAPSTTITKTGALSNIAPSINSIVYTTPTYSTMTGTYATITAYNGTADTTKRTDDLVHAWSLTQSIYGGTVSFNVSSYSTTSLITLTPSSGNSVTLALSQSGVVSIFSGDFSSFPSDFSLNAVITDAGGESVTQVVTFNDVDPGAFTNSFSTAFDI